MGQSWVREGVAIGAIPLIAFVGIIGFGLIGGAVSADIASPMLLAVVAVGASSRRRASGVLTAVIVASGFALIFGGRERTAAIFTAIAAGVIGIAVGVLADRTSRIGTRLDIANARIRRLAMHDALTGLLDRRGFTAALRKQLSRDGGADRRFGLIALDIQTLRAVNEQFGRATGDTVLEVLAESVGRNIRESDIAGRVDADELAVLLAGSDVSEAQRVAERIVLDFERSAGTVVPAQTDPHVSFGIAMFPADGRSPDHLLDAAETRIQHRIRPATGGSM